MDNLMVETRRRPVGVSIVAILVAVGGILTLIGAFTLIFGVGIFGFQFPANTRGLALWYGFLVGLIGVIQLFFSWGLWTLKSWAFWAVIIIEALNILEVLITWFQGYTNFSTFLFRLIIPVVILVYFLADRRVREAFRT